MVFALLLLLLVALPVAGLISLKLQKHMPGESRGLAFAGAIAVMLTICFAGYMITKLGALWQT